MTVLDLRNVESEASSRSGSIGSWDIMISDTGAVCPVRARVSWYTMSVEPLLSSMSTSSSTTTRPRLFPARCCARTRAISSEEKPLSGNPGS